MSTLNHSEFQGNLRGDRTCSQEGLKEECRGSLGATRRVGRRVWTKELKRNLGGDPTCSQEGLQEEFKGNLGGDPTCSRRDRH